MQTFKVIAFAFASCLSSASWAHAHLQKPSPAENSTVPAPTELRLGFSEGVEPGFSQVTLVAADGKKVPTALSVGGDASVLLAKPTTPLAAGAWEVQWKVVSVDTHRSEGHYTFTVE